MGELTTLPQIP